MQNKIILAGLLITSFFSFTQAGWVLQHSGSIQLNDIDFPPNNTSIGFACGNESYVLKTQDGGGRWEVMNNVPRIGNLHAIDFPVNELVGYIAGDTGRVVRTRDGGQNWDRINTLVEYQLNGINFKSDEIGYVVGRQGTILKTENGGDNWEDVSLTERINLNGVYFIDETNGWVVGDNGYIGFTNQSGANWEQQTSGVQAQLLGVHFQDHSTGWVVGAAKTCLKTTNGGEDWDTVDIPLPANTILYSVIFPVDMNTGFVCGNFGRIAKTTDAGTSWEMVTDLLYNLYGIDFPQDNLTGWACGQNEAIFRTTDGGWIEEANSLGEKIENTIDCTPNPFRTTTLIRAPHALSRDATLKIYDCSGNLLRFLTLDKNGNALWDGSDANNHRVAPGVYLIELNDGNRTTQRLKIVKSD